MENAIDTIEPNWNDRDVQARGNHTDAAAKWLDAARFRSLTLGEDEDGPSVAHELAHVLQRVTRPDLALWNRKRVEEETGKVIVQGVGERLSPGVFSREEVRPEELLEHCRCG